MVLFGSRACGNARLYSDIAVFMHHLRDLSQDCARLLGIGINLLNDTGAVINPWSFRTGAYNDPTGLMSELRRDGTDFLAPENCGNNPANHVIQLLDLTRETVPRLCARQFRLPDRLASYQSPHVVDWWVSKVVGGTV
jgi:uncharacterized protein